MSIKPIKKVNVGEQVFDQLKKMLIEGEWKQGDKLPSENELADLFGVSRITVRQALQKLNVLGLIETRLGEGSFVKVIELGDSMQALIPAMYLSGNSAFQILEFREIIESESARLAALRATIDEVEELREIHEEMIKRKNSLDLRGFAALDAEFHYKIGEITKNDLIIKTNTILREVLNTSMVDIIERMGCEPAIYYHGQLIEAIEAKNGKLAMNLMREHIGKNSEYFDDEE